MPDLDTVRVAIATALAVFGAIDISWRLGRWLDKEAKQ